MAWPSLPGLGLGWVERLSQEGRALLGERLSVHIRPPPPVSCLSWLPPPRLTPLCVLPKLTGTPRTSNACLLSPLSCFSPSTPTFLSITLSFCLCTSLAVIVYPSLFFLGVCLLSLPHHSLSFPHCLMSPFPLPFCWGLPSLCHSCLFALMFSYPSPCCLGQPPSYPSQSLSSLLWLPNPGSPEETSSRLEVHWWLLGAQNEGSPPRKGVGRAVRWQPVWPEGSVYAVAWSPPPPLAPRTCWAATTPGLGQSKHCRRQPGYLYQGLGAGPVPTAAPALPCPPQPAPSQRGTSRRGDIPQRQPPLSPEATGLVAQDASNFAEDAQFPLPWKQQHKMLVNMNTHTHLTESSKCPERRCKIETYTTAHTLRPPAHMWDNTDTTCSDTHRG